MVVAPGAAVAPGVNLARARPVDITVIAYNILAVGYLLIHHDRLGWLWIYLVQHVGLIALAAAAGRLERSDRAWRRAIATYYPLLAVLASFSELAVVIQRLDPRLFDDELARIDRRLFGRDLLLWFEGRREPWLTEAVLYCYLTFYFLPVWVVLDVGRRDEQRFAELTFEYVGCFLLSYLGYMLVPAIGPRFFLTGVEQLRGVFAFDQLLHCMNVLEGGARDAFPSGHTAVTLMVIVHVLRFARSLAPILLPVSAGLLFATVYLRFHYVTDVIGGVLLAAFVLVTFPPMFRAWQRRTAP